MAHPATASDLSEKYTLLHTTIHTSTQIATKITRIISDLTGTPDPTEQIAKPIIVYLSARPKAANKLISIVEIAKRELRDRELEFHQYTSLEGETVMIPRDGQKAKSAVTKTAGPDSDLGRKVGHGGGESAGGDELEGGEEDGGDDDDDDEDAFQTMLGLSEMKKRVMPVLKVYLSLVEVRELQSRFG